jgi:signal transduction histidine kinase
MSAAPVSPPASALELAAFDRLRRPVWIYDPATRRGLYANAAAVELWGAPDRETLLARDVSDLSPEVGARIERLAQTTAGGATVSERWTLHSGGEAVTIEAAISAWPLPNGRSALLFEAADASIEPAELEALEAKLRLLTDMSHELRTPLNSVLGFAELLGRTELDPWQSQHLARVVEAGAALKQIADDIVDLTELDNGALTPRPAPFDLAEMLREAVAAAAPSATAKGLSLRLDIAPDAPLHVDGDAGLIGKIVGHYLANAVKFTHWGEIVVSLASPWRAGAIADFEISVADRGPGVDAATKARLFERFTPADDSRRKRHAGRGLGLSIAKEVAQLMGGEVGVESEDGRGARFWLHIELPVVEPAGAGPAETHEPRCVRVLYADDNEGNRVLVQTLLASLGHACDVVNDGAAAVGAVAAGAYDLVLMDIQMPVMDGVTATREIRKFGGATGAIPIVALTANTLTEQLAEYAAAGMNDCIAKPVNLVDLATKTAHWGAARLQDQARSAA